MLLVFLLAARLPVAPLFPTFSFSFHPRRNNSPNMTDIKDDDFNDLDDYDDDEPVADQKEDDAKKYARGTSSSLALARSLVLVGLPLAHRLLRWRFILDLRDADIYASIHAAGFKEFLLKPELIRAIGDCGFEHPSEGNDHHTTKPPSLLALSSIAITT